MSIENYVIENATGLLYNDNQTGTQLGLLWNRNKYHFWETKTLKEMTKAEWESLCDHCGVCCLYLR